MSNWPSSSDAIEHNSRSIQFQDHHRNTALADSFSFGRDTNISVSSFRLPKAVETTASASGSEIQSSENILEKSRSKTPGLAGWFGAGAAGLGSKAPVQLFSRSKGAGNISPAVSVTKGTTTKSGLSDRTVSTVNSGSIPPTSSNMQRNYYEGGTDSAPGSHSRGQSEGVVHSVLGSLRHWSGAGMSTHQEVQIPSSRGFEEMETAYNLRYAQMAQEKDAEIEQLQYKLRLREEAIDQLEQNIQMQQDATEMIRLEMERVQEEKLHQQRQFEQQQEEMAKNQANQSGMTGRRSSSKSQQEMEEEEMKEIIQQLHTKLREKSDTNNALLRTSKTQRDQISSLERTIDELKQQLTEAQEAAKDAASMRSVIPFNTSFGVGAAEADAASEKIEEMKEVIQQLQAKLLDKNNTNAALVRSAKMQNDKAATLRAEIEALKQTADETRQDYQAALDRLEAELQAREYEISTLRDQLIRATITDQGSAENIPHAGEEDLSESRGGDTTSYEEGVARGDDYCSLGSQSGSLGIINGGGLKRLDNKSHNSVSTEDQESFGHHNDNDYSSEDEFSSYSNEGSAENKDHHVNKSTHVPLYAANQTRRDYDDGSYESR